MCRFYPNLDTYKTNTKTHDLRGVTHVDYSDPSIGFLKPKRTVDTYKRINGTVFHKVRFPGFVCVFRFTPWILVHDISPFQQPGRTTNH